MSVRCKHALANSHPTPSPFLTLARSYFYVQYSTDKQKEKTAALTPSRCVLADPPRTPSTPVRTPPSPRYSPSFFHCDTTTRGAAISTANYPANAPWKTGLRPQQQLQKLLWRQQQNLWFHTGRCCPLLGPGSYTHVVQ